MTIPKWRVTRFVERLSTTGLILVILGTLLLSWPTALMLMDKPTRVSRTAENTVSQNDQTQLERAAEYDRNILTDGQVVMGEAVDPFSGNEQPAYDSDSEYQRQLGTGANMAVIRIPSISVNMAIGHGTGETTLETQAGHVYGTTLPVGDPGNSVIAAHRGLGLRYLFYRLGELDLGSMIYTDAAGKTVAWQVDKISRVEPGSDAENKAIQADPHHTYLTLYTCDPPGLNTRRLIIRAHRIPYHDVQWVETAMADPKKILYYSTGVALAMMTVMLIFSPRRPVMRHAASDARTTR
ncbi:sortase [Bifidobacterium sp. SO1]|uniref:sortase n=1 Tax=Bifidobacterium sp. SO1 TaxID=2809029 RepID=UPI001BDCEAD9|nr:sortase [Bifidobacterium sp. SO1]MBT1162750.1 class C sortase [Bifidobacterium sp. SO1]